MTRLGRDGTELPEHDDHDDVHACTAGWLDRDADQPVACPVCRPWLTAPSPRPPRREELNR